MTTTVLEHVRGDKFSAVIRMAIAGRDWTGTTVRCQARTVDERLVWDFVAENGIETDVDDDGRFVILLEAPGSATRRWPLGRIDIDLEAQNADADFGPYTPAAIRINLTRDITR